VTPALGTGSYCSEKTNDGYPGSERMKLPRGPPTSRLPVARSAERFDEGVADEKVL